MQLDRPERGFSYASDAPLDMRMDPSAEHSARDLVNQASERDAPRLLAPAWKSQAAKRDCDTHDVAVGCETALGVPYGVERVVVALSFGQDAVELNAERIDHEHICAFTVAECIQVDSHRIVITDVFTPDDVGADGGRIVLTDEHDVKVALVVGQERRGGLADRCSVAGLTLSEVRDGRAAFVGPSIRRPDEPLEFGRVIDADRFKCWWVGWLCEQRGC